MTYIDPTVNICKFLSVDLYRETIFSAHIFLYIGNGRGNIGLYDEKRTRRKQKVCLLKSSWGLTEFDTLRS